MDTLSRHRADAQFFLPWLIPGSIWAMRNAVKYDSKRAAMALLGQVALAVYIYDSAYAERYERYTLFTRHADEDLLTFTQTAVRGDEEAEVPHYKYESS